MVAIVPTVQGIAVVLWNGSTSSGPQKWGHAWKKGWDVKIFTTQAFLLSVLGKSRHFTLHGSGYWNQNSFYGQYIAMVSPRDQESGSCGHGYRQSWDIKMNSKCELPSQIHHSWWVTGKEDAFSLILHCLPAMLDKASLARSLWRRNEKLMGRRRRKTTALHLPQQKNK